MRKPAENLLGIDQRARAATLVGPVQQIMQGRQKVLLGDIRYVRR